MKAPSSNYLSEILPAVQRERSKNLKAASYLSDPVAWAEDYLGYQLWSKQKEILYAIRDNRKTAIIAGHGVGKSLVVAIAVAWWIDVHPKDPQETFVATTAPFQDQITIIIWDTLRSIHNLSKRRFKDGVVDHALPGYITGENKWKLDNGETIAQGRKPPDNKADSGYQGKHATYLLAIGDEAAGLGTDMIEALGNISTGPYNRMVLIANPTDPSCEMAKIWKSENPDWVRMEISVLSSPLITNEPNFDVTRAGGMSGWDYVNEKKQEWGEDDPRYISRVLGKWSFDAGNNVFTDEDIAKAANAFVLADPQFGIEFGCDIGWRQDSTFVYRREFGYVWETDPETTEPLVATEVLGSKVRYLADWSKIPLISSDPENFGVAERIHNLALAEGASLVKVDASGLGAGILDRLGELSEGKYTVFEVWGSGESSDRRAYLNTRAEQYFRVKERMFAGELDLESADEGLLDELRGIVYETTTKGQIKMESKDDMKRRKAKSPDRADALWYASWDVDHLISGLQPGEVLGYEADDLVGEGSSAFYSGFGGW